MWVLSFLAAFQASSYGPNPTPPAPDEACGQPVSGEIVICKHRDTGGGQRVSSLSAPDPVNGTRDEAGLLHLQLGKSELIGGGPKGSFGIGLHLHF